MRRRSAIPMLGILGVVPFLFGLSGSRTAVKADQEFTIHNEVRLVLLDVSVQSHDGNFVPGLLKKNFTVLENGRPQTISVFDNQDAPVTIGILVDESASMTPKRTQVLAAAEDLIQESNPADEVFILNFNDSVERGLPEGILFSDQIPQLRDALDRGVPRGQTALYDAVADGLMQLEQGKRGRKTLIVISDGRDNASHHTRAQTVDLVERSSATVFTVGLFDAEQYDADPGTLRQFAKISGGEASFPMSLADVSGVCHRIAKEIRTRYTIGYVPLESRNSSPLRHIQVKVSSPGQSGLTVLTRSSYLYDEPKAK